MKSVVAVAALGAAAWTGAAQAADVDCIIEPRKVVEVMAPVEALILRMPVDRGDMVKQGQVVVELDAGLERAAADLAKYRSTMEGPIRAAQSRIDFSTTKFKRKQELAEQKYVSMNDRDEARTEMLLAESELVTARENRRVAELEHRQASEGVRIRTLRSPFDGIVMERNANPGESARSDSNRKPLLKLAQIDVLHVEAMLPVSAYGKLNPGDSLTVLPESPIGGSYAAKVRVVDKVFDGSSGTFGVRLELPNPNLALPAGVRCKLRVPGIAEGYAPGRKAPRTPASGM